MCTRAFAATFFAAVLACCARAGEPQLDRPGELPRRWYTVPELLSALAERDGLRWAVPETLAGNALVGGANVAARAALDEACKQWKLNWLSANGVVVVHRADDAALAKWSAALKAGGAGAVEAAWELGWLRDGRALPALAEALAGADPAVSLAAARAVEILEKTVPLGRTDRVDPVPAGRAALAAAFPPKGDLARLLDSPYPPVRAAALRLLLGQGGAAAEAAAAKTAKDRSVLVEQVRQQMLFATPPPAKPGADKPEVLPPLPAAAEEVVAECRKMIDAIPGFEKNSDWGHMRYRARVIANWSALGSAEATDALIELSGTKAQQGWYPAYVFQHMCRTGGEKVEAKLRERFAQRDRDTLVRGLENVQCGKGLLGYTAPFLAEQTVCYVTANKAGREALEGLVALVEKAAKGHYAAVDALGAVGGPKAVAALRGALGRDEPGESSLAFRAAKALGAAGGAEALDALLEASKSPARSRRHAATLYLGQIGGPKAAARLKEIVAAEKDRLVRSAAAEALEQIGGDEAVAAAAEFRKADAGLPALTYRPRNKRLGPDFAPGKWTDLKIGIKAYAAYGEMGWNYDAADSLHFRYGGCSGYTNELTVFDLGTEEFVQRRPNEEMAGWDSRRPQRGCSAGRTWDPWLKAAWIGPSIGGSGADIAIEEYYVRRGGYALCAYDLATDRFRPSPRAPNCGRYTYDWKNGLMIPVAFTHPNHVTKDWWVLDTRSPDPYAMEAWKNRTDQKAPYPFSSTGRYTIAAVDQESGILVVFVPVHNDPKSNAPGQPPETWTWDPGANVWKNMNPKEQPQPGVWGGGLVYDPFSKLLVLHAGKAVSQYGGPADAMTWTYELKSNTWTEVKDAGGPGNPWVGAMTFDAEHNAALVFNFRGHSVWAYRHKQVPEGTSVRLGGR